MNNKQVNCKLNVFKNASKNAARELGGYYRSKTDSTVGVVECTAQQVPKLHNGYHWRYNFKLDGKVIAVKKLEGLLS